MIISKRFALPLICGFLAFVFFFSAFGLPALAVTDTGTGTEASDVSSGSSGNAGGETEDSETPPVRVQAAYSFDDAVDPTADAAGANPLSTKEFGASMVNAVSGRMGGALKGYFHMKDSLFHTLPQISLGFWTELSLSDARNLSTVFLVQGKDGESLELRLVSEGSDQFLQLYFRDGYNMSRASYNVTDLLTEERSWIHVAFTYRISGTVSLLTLYVNGRSSASSISTAYVDLSRIQCDTAAFHGITVDELYYTDVCLTPAKIASLMGKSAADFLAAENKEIEGESEGDVQSPVILPEAHAYNWAAYLFDGTFAAGTDYHSGDVPATVDPSCVLIDTAKLAEKYGYAVIRREASVPASYLTLDPRLFYGQQAFTFTCWVYRTGKTAANEEILLSLKGTGVFRFAPYAVDEDGTGAAYLEYTDTRGNVQRQSLDKANKISPKNKWVHYGVTVTSNGDITVYADGVSLGTFASGVNPATLAFAECKVLTGSSAYDTTRTALDEIYVAPKALSDGDIRRIHAYGLQRYTSEVLPDPGDVSTDGDASNPYAPDAVDLAEDAYSQTGTIANGFVGTTFDQRSQVGQDWNNAVNATVTGGRLTQGISSYGLSLDGNSFLRYPAGILDGARGLTISLSYCWDGSGADPSRSQRLFDFSRKLSSVTDPAASVFLEMGNGISGLRFGISDGVSSTYLTCDYSAVNTWTRITVTVADGKIVLYLNGEVAATGDTQVDLSAINPNFCYIGRSGVKGDPAFTGIVDEIYLSASALSAEEEALFRNGLSAALNGERKGKTDLWGMVLIGIIVAAVLLVVAVITVIIVIIVRKEKRSPEDEAPMPVSITGAENDGTTVVGPRSARRNPPAAPVEEGDATVKFRKVADRKEADPVADTEMTAKFRKVTDREDPSVGIEVTAKFQKISDPDGSDQ